MKNQFLRASLRWLGVALGAFLYAFGFYAFVKSAGITTGGVTGFVNIVNMIHPVPMGLLIMLINIPLLLISLFVLKWKFTVSTLVGTALESAFLTLLETFCSTWFPLTDNVMISGAVGGIIIGCGLGLIMKCGSSTGGADIIMKLVHKKWRYLSGGTIHLCIDAAILLFFLCVTKDLDATVYAILTMFISNVMYDIVLYGVNTSKTVHIITSSPDLMTQQLLEQCECGITILDAKGAYTKRPKNLLLCVVRNHMFPVLRDIVHECDENAFMIVSKSSEIYGNGYKDYRDVL